VKGPFQKKIYWWKRQPFTCPFFNSFYCTNACKLWTVFFMKFWF